MYAVQADERMGFYYCSYCQNYVSYNQTNNVISIYSIYDKLFKVANRNLSVIGCSLVRQSDLSRGINEHSIKKTLVKVSSGNFDAHRLSLICGSVKVKDGNIKILSSSVQGNVVCHRGDVILSSEKYVIQGFGEIRPQCTIYGDVVVKAGTVTLSDTQLHGSLKLTSNKMTIGKGSVVYHLKMECVRPSMILPQYTERHKGCYNKNMHTPAMLGLQRRQRAEEDDTKKHQALRITQFITLEADATLKQLDFSGDWCVLTLEENARYEGDIPSNLEIIYL